MNIQPNPTIKMKIKERPIIFSGPMVNALLEGRKTQTRRIVKAAASPYGHPGDGLWVRETYGIGRASGLTYYRDGKTVNGAPSNGFFDAWKPSLFMPRSRSRITLEVTASRCERLNDISESDALAEGIHRYECPQLSFLPQMSYYHYRKEAPSEHHFLTAAMAFRGLWGSINGVESWVDNPLVWVIEFKVNEIAKR